MTEETTQPQTAAPKKDYRSRLFWPSLVAMALIMMLLVLKLSSSGPVQHNTVIDATPQGNAPFELLVTKVITNQQRLELAEVELEYWKQHRLKRGIVRLKRGSLTDRVARFAPDWLKRQVKESDLNSTTAHIITKCKATVEFEISFKDPKQWKIQITDDTAKIQAPPFIVDDVNVPPEHLHGWVVEEDFIIDGEKERDVLLQNVRRELAPLTQSDDFRNKYREECRANLRIFFMNLFQALKDDRLGKVKHIYVEFADDPVVGESAPSE